MYIQIRNRVTDVENKLMVTRGERDGAGQGMGQIRDMGLRGMNT